MGNADALSRCPLPKLVSDPAGEAPVLRIDLVGPGVVTAADVAAETEKDPILRKVMEWVKKGWPGAPHPTEFIAYARRQHELAVQDGCLLWGERVLAPLSLREEILKELHEGHPGIVRMKSLARSYVWWPNLDSDIEQWVAGCPPCQLSRAAPPKTPVWDWEQPKAPWSRVHVDFAGPFHGQTFLIAVDAYSKWLEVIIMKATTAEALIQALRKLFATHGHPDTLVSDNGPQLTAIEFESFLATLGVKHTLIPPYNPSSNGLAERAVRATKEALSRLGPGDWQARIDVFLLAQHITPIGNTGKSPAELLMGRQLRSKIARLHPQYIHADRPPPGKIRAYSVNTQVYARNYTAGPKWIPGVIIEQNGPKTYTVRLDDDRIWRRHIDQIRERHPPNTDWQGPQVIPMPTVPTDPPRIEEPADLPGDVATPPCDAEASSAAAPDGPLTQLQQREPEEGNTSSLAQPSGSTELRRSSRQTTRPAYLGDYVCRLGGRDVTY